MKEYTPNIRERWNSRADVIKQALGAIAAGSGLLLLTACGSGETQEQEVIAQTPTPTLAAEAQPVFDSVVPEEDISCAIVGKEGLSADDPNCIIEPNS